MYGHYWATGLGAWCCCCCSAAALFSYRPAPPRPPAPRATAPSRCTSRRCGGAVRGHLAAALASALGPPAVSDLVHDPRGHGRLLGLFAHYRAVESDRLAKPPRRSSGQRGRQEGCIHKGKVRSASGCSGGAGPWPRGSGRRRRGEAEAAAASRAAGPAGWALSVPEVSVGAGRHGSRVGGGGSGPRRAAPQRHS